MIVGQIIKMKNKYYICVNQQGTLEKITTYVNPKRVLLWHFRNFFKRFKTVQETKDFLRIKRRY